MTKEIIEAILADEQRAEELLKKANKEAQNLLISADRAVDQLQRDLKLELKNLTESNNLEIEADSKEQFAAANKKLSGKLKKMQEKAEKNIPTAKAKLLEYML